MMSQNSQRRQHCGPGSVHQRTGEMPLPAKTDPSLPEAETPNGEGADCAGKTCLLQCHFEWPPWTTAAPETWFSPICRGVRGGL